MSDIFNIKNEFAFPSEERALLSLCLKDINNFYVVSSALNSDDFLLDEHQVLYSMIKNISNSGAKTIDFHMLLSDINTYGLSKSVGGLDYVHAIYNMLVSVSNMDLYIKIVEEASNKFKLYIDMADAVGRIKDTSKNKDETFSDLSGSIINSIISTYNKRKISSGVNLNEGFLEYIENKRNKYTEMSGLQTGYTIFDRQIDGLVNSTLTFITARKKTGKSAFLSNVACNVGIKQLKSIIYFDTEMRFDEWRDRSIAIISGINERIIKHGGYDDTIYNKLIKVNKIIEKCKIYHEFIPGYTVDKLIALSKKYKVNNSVDLIIFDYLKEPELSSVSRNRKEYQLLGDVTTALKDLAAELDLPILAAAQINREGDIADSDRIARYADVIAQWMPMTNEEKSQGGDTFKKGNYKLIIRDSRRGGHTPETGIGYMFKKSRLKITEIPIYDQLIDYSGNVVNYGSVPGEDIEDGNYSDEDAIK